MHGTEDRLGRPQVKSFKSVLRHVTKNIVVSFETPRTPEVGSAWPEFFRAAKNKVGDGPDRQ